MAELMIDDRLIQTPGGRLFARRWTHEGSNAGVPIILLHDSLGSVEQWRDLPDRMVEATGRPVIAYDRLGFGRSDPHPGTLQPDFIRDEARRGLGPVREAFGLERMVLFGHSVGGGMAVAGAAEYGDLTDGVITVSAQAFREDRTVAGIQEAKRVFQADDQVARVARYHGDKARWVLDAWIETWLAPSFADWSLDPELCQLRSPVLALHGDQDEYGTVAHPERIARAAGGPVSLVILEGCHHLPHREKPEIVLKRVGDFVRGL